MNRSINELNKKTSLAVKLLLTSLLITATSAVIAGEKNQGTGVAYVDSVLKWGAWELDIEPAAGGISAPQPRALNARSSKVALRTNSIAALAPPTPDRGTPANPIIPGTPIPTPVIPAPPVKPFIPTAPTNLAPPGATPPTVVTFPAPTAPTSFAPSGATPPTVVTLP